MCQQCVVCAAILNTNVDFPKVCCFPITPDAFKHINAGFLLHHPNSAQSSNITFTRDI